jgi:hypothetical protein
MDLSRFENTLQTFAAAAGRRDAVRSLGALGLGALAALGLTGDATNASDKRRDKRRGPQRNQHKPGPASAGAEAKKKKKKPKPGPAGPGGPLGPTGPTGAAGAIDKFTTIDVFENAQLGGNLFDTATLTPRCPNVNGKVLGGGFDCAVSGGLSSEITVNAAFPTARDGATPEGFQVEFTRTATVVSGDIVVTAFVKCTL